MPSCRDEVKKAKVQHELRLESDTKGSEKSFWDPSEGRRRSRRRWACCMEKREELLHSDPASSKRGASLA